MQVQSPNLPPPVLVDTAQAFADMMSRLLAVPAVAVDTESNSLYAYTERVCLIQLSIPGVDYILDPLAVDDIGDLGQLFGTPDIEKVFHAAEYDVMVLRRDYGFEFANLFDTMIASRILGWSRHGLGSLLTELFGVRTDKRMQRTNWGRRPLSPEQLEYARLDTHFLLPLRDILMAELEEQRRVEEARAAFARIAQSRWTQRTFDPEGSRTLDGTGLAVLRELYAYREQRAREMDRPPFKVLGDSTLVALSRARPRNRSELRAIKGLPRRLPVTEQRRILKAIARGIASPLPRRPPVGDGSRPDEATKMRYEALRRWRRRRAQERGVDPDVVLSNRALRLLAHHNPTSHAQLKAIGALNDWEMQEYAREVLATLRAAQA